MKSCKKTFFVSFFVVIFYIVFCFASCSYGIDEVFGRLDNVNTRTGDIKYFCCPESLDTQDTQGEYTVAVVTDLHFNRESVHSSDSHKDVENRFYNWLCDMGVQERPRFVLCLGDVTEHGLSREYKMYQDYVKKIESLDSGAAKIKVYTTIGNHDLLNNGYTEYKKYISKDTFFCFKTPGFSWYFFDTANGTIGINQYEELLKALKKDPLPKVLCTHYPLYAAGAAFCCLSDTTERNLLLHYFAKYDVKALFVGHSHSKHFSDMGPFTEYNIPGWLDRSEWALATIKEKEGKVAVDICP